MTTVSELVKRVLKFVLDIFQTIVIALAIFVILYQFIAQPHRVQGASMEPNFQNAEYILTEKVGYYFHEPRRGDVIVFKFPKNKELDYIKRVIALPGETVTLRGGAVVVNGRRLEEPYLTPGTFTAGHTTLKEGAAFAVPPDSYVVMGDNRERSSDSREWGTVPKEDIIGRAFFRYWPPSEVGFVKDH